MAKYLVLWELDMSRAPVDPKERAAAWGMMVDVVKQDLKEGKDTDWGCFVGEARGYAISERSEVDLMKDLQRFYPFITFKTYSVVSIDQLAEVVKAVTG